MKALITGASSGIGKAIAMELASYHIDVILVARRKNLLELLSHEIETKYKVHVQIEVADICQPSAREKIICFYNDIDIFVNNAGFGVIGESIKTNMEDEVNMINLNVVAFHILLKHYNTLFNEKKKGYILNVGSVASFLPGPKMAAYYASKAYVLSISEALYFENKYQGSEVGVTCLCPGPTESEFDKVAKSKFSLKKQTAEEVAFYGVKAMFLKKRVAIPSFKLKILLFLQRIVPHSIACKIIFHSQNKKIGK